MRVTHERRCHDGTHHARIAGSPSSARCDRGLALAGCAGGSGDSGDGDTLKLWHYEGDDSAMGIAWAEAIKVFEEETGATVEFEEKCFEQIH